MKEEIFISTLAIFLVFNTFYFLINGVAVSNLALSGITSILVTGVILAIVTGINALTFSLSDTTIKIIFVTVVLMNILFNVSIRYDPLGINFSIGLGLASNIINVFSMSNDLWSSLGWILASSLSFMAFVSGIMIVAEDG